MSDFLKGYAIEIVGKFETAAQANACVQGIEYVNDSMIKSIHTVVIPVNSHQAHVVLVLVQTDG